MEGFQKGHIYKALGDGAMVQSRRIHPSVLLLGDYILWCVYGGGYKPHKKFLEAHYA